LEEEMATTIESYREVLKEQGRGKM